MFVGHQSVEPGHITASAPIRKETFSGFRNESRRRDKVAASSSLYELNTLYLKKWLLLRVQDISN